NLPNRPTWKKVNPADAPILILSLKSDTEPLDRIFEAANTVLAQKIAQTSGVGQVVVGGGQQPAVRVRVDPDVLAGAGFSLEDLRAAISAATANQPKGLVSGPEQAASVAASDQLFGADRWRPLIVGTHAGAVIRLGDVAEVFDDVEN